MSSAEVTDSTAPRLMMTDDKGIVCTASDLEETTVDDDDDDDCVLKVPDRLALLQYCLDRGGSLVENDGSSYCTFPIVNIVMECGPSCQEALRLLFDEYQATLINCPDPVCRRVALDRFKERSRPVLAMR